ncbi:hypothetical protein HDV03_000482 [Kappamyces sp. JEL0829]|nr:hypothetical protein HDV03_000482 [Kappamyces sp. JEL0829]KAJ3342418.1 hypothetical protein HDU91_000540 [Kappamyces sp. JEL0680]
MDTLSEQELADFKRAFACFDRDKDGTITTTELGTVLRSLGQNPTEAELQELIIQLDQDKNGTVEFEELLAVITNNLVEVDEMQELKEIFAIMDKDKNGLIGYADLKAVVLNSGLEIPEAEVEKMIDEADRDGDKQLAFEDFCEIIVSHGQLTQKPGSLQSSNLDDIVKQAALLPESESISEA